MHLKNVEIWMKYSRYSQDLQQRIVNFFGPHVFPADTSFFGSIFVQLLTHEARKFGRDRVMLFSSKNFLPAVNRDALLLWDQAYKHNKGGIIQFFISALSLSYHAGEVYNPCNW